MIYTRKFRYTPFSINQKSSKKQDVYAHERGRKIVAFETKDFVKLVLKKIIRIM